MTKEKFKAAFLKVLPLLIVLVSTAVFMFLIKFVVGLFYEPKDTVYEKTFADEHYIVVQCYQNPSSHYYLHSGSYVFDPDKHGGAASDHDKTHLNDNPLAIFTLNESPIDMENATVRRLFSGNGLDAYQLDEFVVYRLEGQYGVFAPLREYKESATDRKNDLYVIRQLLKDDRWKNFVLPEWETEQEFFEKLEKIERYLNAEYED